MRPTQPLLEDRKTGQRREYLFCYRARATIATQLLNAPEPLSLADLKEWLGHKHYSSTQHYAAVLQRKLSAAHH